MKPRVHAVGDRRNLFNWLNDAGFVIYGHDGDASASWHAVETSFQGIQLNLAATVNSDPPHGFAGFFKPFADTCNGWMLQPAEHQSGRIVYGPVV
jgi:hypothetical protein